jgi:hypothetical protein
MNELIYEYWHFARPLLVKSYLGLVLDGPGDPIALQSPRRWGKTTFLLAELTPAARKAGFLPVYIDVWQNRENAAEAIVYGLQEALDDLQIPRSNMGKNLKTPVRELGVGAASIEFAEQPSRRRPDAPLLLIDWLLKSIIHAAGSPVLLMIDEVQELAARKEDKLVSALRSAITKNRRSVRVIFTGSSQEELNELFARARAPLYEGASVLPFPHLDENFLRFVAEQAAEKLKVTLPYLELHAAFERFHYQPRALIDLVFLYASSRSRNLSALLEQQLDAQLSSSAFESTWNSLGALQKAICARVVRGEELTSAAALREYAALQNKKHVSPGSVSSALRKLLGWHLLARIPGPRGGYRIDDQLLHEWLRRRNNARSVVRAPRASPRRV